VRILLVGHGYPPEASGGTERCVEATARGLAARHEVGVLHRSADAARPDHELRESTREGVRLFSLNNLARRAAGFEAYRNPLVAARAAELLERFAPELVHVHHLHGLSTGLVFEARRRGVPVVITLHDFWPACALGQLVNLRHRVCPGPTPRRCLGCVGGLAAGGPLTLALPLARLVAPALPWASRRVAERLDTMREVLRSADLVLAPSRFLGQRLSALGFGEIGYLPNPREPLPEAPRRPSPDGRFRIGFVGACIPSKGVHVLAEAFGRLEEPRARLLVYGPFPPYHGDSGYRDRVAARLRGVPGAADALQGAFPHERLGDVLAGLDCLVVPSVWEENAPRTVEEAFAARLPLVASDHGGLRERIRHEVDGLLVRPGDAGALARALLRLVREAGLSARLCREPRLAPGLGEHVSALEARYAEAHERYARRSGRVGVVVVDRGRPHDTAAALASAHDPSLAPALLAVENGPGPAPELPPEAELLRLPENRGFAAGANAGLARLRERGCDRALVLNNDARLEPGALRRLAEALEPPGTAAAGPLLLRPDGRVESRGLRLDPWTGRSRLLGHGEPDRRAEGRAPVEALSGAALMLRLSALEAVGGLDEQYFHSFEDAEWCHRARRAGLELMVVFGARATHAAGTTLGASSDRLYYAARNHQRAVQHVRPLAGAGAALRRLAVLLQDLAHAVRQSDVPRLEGLRAVCAGFADFRRGRFGPRSA
jgi:GT2 family glycosyltransferase